MGFNSGFKGLSKTKQSVILYRKFSPDMPVIRIQMVSRLKPLAGSKEQHQQTAVFRGFVACRFQALPYCLFPLSPAARLGFSLSCFCVHT